MNEDEGYEDAAPDEDGGAQEEQVYDLLPVVEEVRALLEDETDESLESALQTLCEHLTNWHQDDAWWEAMDTAFRNADPDALEQARSLLLDGDVADFLTTEYEVLLNEMGASPATARFIVTELQAALLQAGVPEDAAEALTQAIEAVRVAAQETCALVATLDGSEGTRAKVAAWTGKGLRGAAGGTTVAANLVGATSIPLVGVVASGLGGVVLIHDAFRHR